MRISEFSIRGSLSPLDGGADAQLHPSTGRCGLRFFSYDVQGKVLAGLSRHRDHPQLLQQTEGICVLPHFGNLALSEAVGVRTRNHHVLASGRDTSPLLSMGGAGGVAGDDLIAFSNQVLNRELA